jgi:hypothetical protein
MQGSDEGHRSGKPAKGAAREARLALKLRQNLVRRKEKARAAAKSAGVPAEMSAQRSDRERGD